MEAKKGLINEKMDKKIIETNQLLRKIAKENGYYIIPIDDMNKIYYNFDYIQTENKRIRKRNKELRDEIARKKKK